MPERNWFAKRFRPFADKGWDLLPQCYQLRNEDGTAGSWIARVAVLNHRSTESSGEVLMDKIGRYGTEEEAIQAALTIGLHWLEREAA